MQDQSRFRPKADYGDLVWNGRLEGLGSDSVIPVSVCHGCNLTIANLYCSDAHCHNTVQSTRPHKMSATMAIPQAMNAPVQPESQGTAAVTFDRLPPILVFNVNETLLDITTLEPLFERCFDDPDIMRSWFAQLVLYSQTMTMSGLYIPFGDLAVGALRMVSEIQGQIVIESDVNELRERIGAMPAHPDVTPGLTRLRDAGFRLVTLTNSAPAPSPTPLQRAGLYGFFEQSFSVDSVRRFKPAPETYAYVATQMGVKSSALCLVACHLWNTIGAQSAGWLGALLTQPYNALLPAAGLPRPDFVAPDLVDLARQILEIWPTP